MNFLLTQIKNFFKNPLGLLLVLSNLILGFCGLYQKSWDYSSFHFFYEPITIKILTIINLPAIFFGGVIYELFYNRPEIASSLIEIKDTEMFLIVLFGIFQWLLLGYLLNLLLQKDKEKIK